MAFMGLLIVDIFLLALLVGIILSIIFLIVGIVQKIRKKKSAVVFFVLSILCIMPTVISVGLFTIVSRISTVTLYDGSKKIISTKKKNEFVELIEKDNLTDSELEAIDELLSDSPNLIYYLGSNGNGMIDYGLINGDYDLVEMALKHGAIYDDARRYDAIYTYDNSMDCFLSNASGRTITSEDVDILKSLFENNASTEFEEMSSRYSNYFGKACWYVLYNDETVTDTELEFIKVFSDNGFYNDEGFVLYEDLSDDESFSDAWCFDVTKDDNYYELLDLVMR